MIDDLGISHSQIGGNRLLFLRFPGICRLLGGQALLRVPADVEYKSTGGLFLCPVLGCIVHGHRQLRLIQAITGQFLLSSMIGHIVVGGQVADIMQVILYPPSVQRERLSIPLGKVNVLLAPACGAVLLIGDCIVLHPVKPQPGHLIQLRDVVVVYHVAEPRVKLVQGVAGGQIHLSIPNGHISLGIHGAEVAEQYLVVLLPGAQCNGAYWVIQAVLARILHLLNDEGRREGLERLQQLAYLFSVHGERLISII